MSEYKFGNCTDCGALIRGTLAQDKHSEFHENIDELIDWAQSVSKLFDPEAPQKAHFDKIKDALRSNYNSGIEEEGLNESA